jgi:hypothetical protein
MTRLILREVTRWGRAVGAPLVVLTIVTFGPALSPFGSVWLVPDRALSIGWLAAVIAALTWLLTSAVRAALQPARDHQASEHLRDLRVRSGLPDHALLCVLHTSWSTPAGDRVKAVDVRTCALVDLWLTESGLGDGSYALVKFRRGEGVLVDAVPPGVVSAAQRHAQRDGPERPSARPGRRERRAAARVIRGAEMLLR